VAFWDQALQGESVILSTLLKMIQKGDLALLLTVGACYTTADR